MQVVTVLAKAFALCAIETEAQELKAGIMKQIPVEGTK